MPLQRWNETKTGMMHVLLNLIVYNCVKKTPLKLLLSLKSFFIKFNCVDSFIRHFRLFTKNTLNSQTDSLFFYIFPQRIVFSSNFIFINMPKKKKRW